MIKWWWENDDDNDDDSDKNDDDDNDNYKVATPDVANDLIVGLNEVASMIMVRTSPFCRGFQRGKSNKVASQMLFSHKALADYRQNV